MPRGGAGRQGVALVRVAEWPMSRDVPDSAVMCNDRRGKNAECPSPAAFFAAD